MRYVAFHRALNVGGRRIKMADLQSVYCSLGLPDAQTYIASGNVIFTSDVAPGRRDLEEAFERTFGFASDVILRSAGDIDSILRRIPWTDEEGTIEVSLLHAAPDPEKAAELEAAPEPPEALVVDGSEVFYLRTRTASESSLKETTTMRILGTNTTRRGLRTMRTVYSKLLAEDDAK